MTKLTVSVSSSLSTFVFVFQLHEQSYFNKMLLTVLDECTMKSRLAFESVNTTLHDIRDNNKIMAGITVVLVGDIRSVSSKRPKAAKPTSTTSSDDNKLKKNIRCRDMNCWKFTAVLRHDCLFIIFITCELYKAIHLYPIVGGFCLYSYLLISIKQI